MQIDEEVITMANALKQTQAKCEMLGLVTSGSKRKKVFGRVQGICTQRAEGDEDWCQQCVMNRAREDAR